MTRGVSAVLEEGSRFGRLTVVLPEGGRVLARCDCGEVKFFMRFNLVDGNSKSCGCWRVDNSREKAIRTSGEQAVRGWREGWWDREKAKALALANSVAQRGVEAAGANAKGPGHHSVKWYAVRSPEGVVLEGFNLSHLVRQNRHLFLPEDVLVKVNEWGTEVDCKAMRGLRTLFANPTKRAKAMSWKGWTSVVDRK